MQIIALEFTYHMDYLEVLDDIAGKIRKIQRSFDKWLYNRDNDHGLWVIENGTKKAVSFSAEDFAEFINTQCLGERSDKATVVRGGDSESIRPRCDAVLLNNNEPPNELRLAVIFI